MNQFPKGHEPICPVQGPKCRGVVRTRGASACHPCSRMQPDSPPALTTEQAREVASLKVDGDSAEVSRLSPEPVRTLADLIRVCEIDTETWEIERWVANKWEQAHTDAKKQSHVTPLFQVKAWLKRKTLQLAIRDEIAALVADAKRRIPARPTSRRATTSSGYMLEIAIPDLHIGKLAWGKETGEANYDSKIAEAVFLDALDALLARTASYRFERVVFPVGNDLLNADNLQNTTTRGTPQTSDSRYQKSFTVARQLMTRAIERLRQIAPVHVILVPGNHDTLSTWHLGDSLSCYFHGTPDVLVDNEPRTRKYVQFGRVMLMFTHGDKGKRANYPLVMATEQPEMFGATVHREAHTGHLHQMRVEELHGVKVRISPALCPADAWHAENMYTGNARAAEAFVWSATEGMVGTALFTVQHRRDEDAA